MTVLFVRISALLRTFGECVSISHLPSITESDSRRWRDSRGNHTVETPLSANARDAQKRDIASAFRLIRLRAVLSILMVSELAGLFLA